MAPIAGALSRSSVLRGKHAAGLSARPAVGSRFGTLGANKIARRSGVRRSASASLEDGQMVTIHYIMKFADGEVGDDTRKRNAPATLPIGQGQLFPKLEAGIKEMEEGETKTFEIACADAYGSRDDEKVQKLPASPEELESLKQQVQPGQMVQLPNGEAKARKMDTAADWARWHDTDSTPDPSETSCPARLLR